MKVFATSPQKIVGNWAQGFALDLHSSSSEFLGHDEYGRPMFSTVRTEVGEALYKLKYSQDPAEVVRLAATAAAFVKSWKCGADLIVPVPASKRRRVAPVLLVGQKLAEVLGLEFVPSAVKRTTQLPELKNVVDFGERQKLLAGAHSVDAARVTGRKVLLFDDLFRSGATMNAVTDVLLKSGGASKVFALTLTRTRSSR
jgi:predicted amidophosphoribosyltransferase